jgi:hypothetical protein
MKDKSMNNKVIWLIDENKSELRAFQRELARRLGNNVKVEALDPYNKIQDYVKGVLSDDRTVAIIIDQKLKDTGKVHYTGIELAEYLRGIKPKLPIYILTNFPDPDIFSGKELNVEYILDKSDFKDDAKAKTIAARILRHIDTYTDILSERGQRFEKILEKSMKHKLTKDEYDELEQLKYIRLSPILASELEKAQELEKTISANQKLLSQLKGNKKDAHRN